MAIFTQHRFWITISLLSGCILAQTTGTDSTATPSITPPPTHAPFPTAKVIPLPPEFSDIPKESIACWDSSIYYSYTHSFLNEEINSARRYTQITLPTPRVFTETYLYPDESCKVNYPGLTTLCDGYPRASDCITRCTTKSVSTHLSVYSVTYDNIAVDPPWATEISELPVPKCTPAPDLSPLCARLAEAYSWRAAQMPANATGTLVPEHVMRPQCSVFKTPAAKPKCSLNVGSYEGYYWPTSTPLPSNDSRSCAPNATAIPTGTPTIPVPRKTATTSGLTMTSPYAYHLLRNITLYTVKGYASSISPLTDGHVEPIYASASSLSSLTLSQHPSSILAMEQECHKPSPRGATRCTRSHPPDYLIEDMFTVDPVHYYGAPLRTPSTVTICQASYKPVLALPLNDIASQNGVARECEWTWEHSQRTQIVGDVKDAVSFEGVKGSDWHAITTAKVAETGVPRPGSGMRRMAVTTQA